VECEDAFVRAIVDKISTGVFLSFFGFQVAYVGLVVIPVELGTWEVDVSDVNAGEWLFGVSGSVDCMANCLMMN